MRAIDCFCCDTFFSIRIGVEHSAGFACYFFPIQCSDSLIRMQATRLSPSSSSVHPPNGFCFDSAQFRTSDAHSRPLFLIPNGCLSMLYCASLAAQQQLLTASLLRTGSFFFPFLQILLPSVGKCKGTRYQEKKGEGGKSASQRLPDTFLLFLFLFCLVHFIH